MIGYGEEDKNNRGLIIPPPNPYIQAPGSSPYNQNNPAPSAGGGNQGWIAGATNPSFKIQSYPSEPPEAPPSSGECQTSNDCPKGYKCVNGKCMKETGDETACFSDKDCMERMGEGYVCIDGRCVHKHVSQCNSDADCMDGYTCGDDGICHKIASSGCASDADCDEGYECVNGNCVKKDTQGECGKDADCNDGYECINGRCVKSNGDGNGDDNAGVEGTSGYWTPPTADLSSPPGYEWAKEMYSPQLLDYINKMYGEVSQEPKSLEDMYQGFLEKNPALEQIQYNQALARLKGQQTASTESLNRAMSTRRGGAESGGYINSLEDIARTYGRGVQDIATNQAVRNMTEQEARQQNLIGYAGQDIANRQDWLGTMGGWAGQVMPFEQWNIQTPHDWAYQKAGFNLNDAVIQEQINAARRGETMGWLTSLMNWQNQLGSQYYTGQGQWGDYQNTRGGNILPGYGM